MRVALTVEPCWQRAPGGTAAAAAALAGALARIEAVDPVGVAAFHRGPPKVEVPVPVRHLTVPRIVMYELWHRLRSPAVERVTGPVDVVHATGGAMPPCRAPLVATVHDLAWEQDPAHFTRRGVRFHRRALELALAEASFIICPSEATATDLEAAGADRERVRVIPWGVDQAPGDAAAARRRHDLPQRFLLFVGTVEPRKNLGRLLSALEELGADAPPLVLVGPGGWGDAPAELRDRLPRLATPVRTLGFVEQRWLADLYAAATVVCYPSLREGFGLPVLEAMAQGTPVITSAGTATEEAAGGAAVLVDPTDTQSIARAIVTLWSDPDEQDRRAAAGRARAAELTWERCAAEHVSVYRQAMA